MRKITDFLIEKRQFVFITFLLLTILSFFLTTKVNINYEISEYLPSSSEVRKGLDISNKFKTKMSTLNVLVKDLNSNEKEDGLNYLENLENVKEVS